MRITLDYLSEAEEMALSEREDVFADLSLKPVMSREEVVAARAFIRANVYVDRACRAYAVRLVHATRPPTDDPTGSLHRQCLDDLYIGDRSPVLVGCSPRTHLVLVNLAKTRAFLKGRDEVWYEDLQDLAFERAQSPPGVGWHPVGATGQSSHGVSGRPPHRAGRTRLRSA